MVLEMQGEKCTMKVGIFIRDVDESGVSYTIYDEYRIRRIVAVGVPDTLEEKAPPV